MSVCTVTGTIMHGTLPAAGVTVYCKQIQKTGEVQFTASQRVATSDALGVVTFDLPQSCIAYIEGEFQCGTTNFNVQGGVALTIPAAASATLESLSAAVIFPQTGVTVQDDGVALANPAATLNFGTGLVVTEVSPGVIDVDASGGGALDADLVAIAALDSATAGAIASDGAGWIKKTYAAFKTALGLVKADVGLGSVDNTTDAGKPVSTAQQTALDLKANLAGGNALTGNQTLNVGQTTSAQTDLLINPTTKASGKLISLQVNSVERFGVDQAGTVASAGIVATGAIMINAGQFMGWTGLSKWFPVADGSLAYYNAAGTGFTSFILGPTVPATIGAASTHAQSLAILQCEELLTIAAAATSTTTMQVPAGAIVLAVSVRTTVAIPTAANYTVKIGAQTFNTAAVGVAANSTDPGTAAGAFYNATAGGVIITPNLTPGANTGRVRVTVSYILVTPPTS